MTPEEVAAMEARYTAYDTAFLRLWEQTGAEVAASEAGTAEYSLSEWE